MGELGTVRVASVHAVARLDAARSRERRVAHDHVPVANRKVRRQQVGAGVQVVPENHVPDLRPRGFLAPVLVAVDIRRRPEDVDAAPSRRENVLPPQARATAQRERQRQLRLSEDVRGRQVTVAVGRQRIGPAVGL